MKTLIKLDLNKLISNKLLFLLFGLTIFSMDERITQTLSSQQFILYIFTEHYYLTYLMMPIFMLSIYSSLDAGNIRAGRLLSESRGGFPADCPAGGSRRFDGNV